VEGTDTALANTLAYYKMAKITGVKSFIVQALEWLCVDIHKTSNNHYSLPFFPASFGGQYGQRFD
jgi:hypothetical protein